MLPIYIINFLFAVSATMGMTFLPLLVTEGLGLSLFMLGIIEGSTEFMSNVLRLVTGNAFDRIKNQRTLFIIPAIIALFSKSVLCFPNALSVVMSRLLERIANGAFAAPRDAYVGKYTKNKGESLGYLNISKALGCILGPVLIASIVYLTGSLKDNIHKIVYFALTINIIAFILVFLIKGGKLETKKSTNVAFNFSEFKLSLKPLYPIFFLILLFFLGRFNDGMIMMHLKKSGFPEWFYIITISMFNVIMLIVSPIIGRAVDNKHINTILTITAASLIMSNLCFSSIHDVYWTGAISGLIYWGIQRAGASIAFSSLIFKHTPPKFYGTMIGIYSVLSGVGTLIASSISGYLAQSSFHYVFYLSVMFASAALITTFYITKRVKNV